MSDTHGFLGKFKAAYKNGKEIDNFHELPIISASSRSPRYVTQDKEGLTLIHNNDGQCIFDGEDSVSPNRTNGYNLVLLNSHRPFASLDELISKVPSPRFWRHKSSPHIYLRVGTIGWRQDRQRICHCSGSVGWEYTLAEAFDRLELSDDSGKNWQPFGMEISGS